MQIKQSGFVAKLQERLSKEHPEHGYSDKDLQLIIDMLFKELSSLLKQGYRVIFPGAMSFYLKSIKRKCYNMNTKEYWWTYKKRIRFTPSKHMRESTEVEITEDDYLESKKK